MVVLTILGIIIGAIIVISLYALMLAIAFFAQTKPVHNINR